MKSGKNTVDQKYNLPEDVEDPRLGFYPMETLEALQNLVGEPPVYGKFSEYQHLRDRPLDLDALPLTDKQLTAVSLVFYGRVKKKRAARVMKITAQALDDHIKAALKKIQQGFE